LEKIAKLIKNHRRFLITTHALPDGDGLGAEIALHLYLKKIGKESQILNTHATPEKFSLIDPQGEIQVFTGKKLPEVDVVFIMDTSDWKMLGVLCDPLQKLKAAVVFMDHHISNTDPANHLIDERFGSTGELVYRFLESMGAKLDLAMARAIYVAILTDTASFRFKRTTAESHEIAAVLLRLGVSPEGVYQSIYGRDSLAKIRLWGHVLENIKTSDDERVAWLVVTKEMRHRYGATVEDTESYVNPLTLLEGVDIGMLFREEDDGKIKVSLRGNGEVPVIDIAQRLGGGGHRHAAGVRLVQPLPEAIRILYQLAREVIEEGPKRE
jgi:bifunctional oligoribonuclease and PAP phosphatase NrnA